MDQIQTVWRNYSHLLIGSLVYLPLHQNDHTLLSFLDPIAATNETSCAKLQLFTPQFKLQIWPQFRSKIWPKSVKNLAKIGQKLGQNLGQNSDLTYLVSFVDFNELGLSFWIRTFVWMPIERNWLVIQHLYQSNLKSGLKSDLKTIHTNSERVACIGAWFR